jgi:hypothetical protein
MFIELISDSTSCVRSAESTMATHPAVRHSYKTRGGDAKLSADAQVAAAVNAHAALREQVASLWAAAARAPGRSHEQIAASNLAAPAQAEFARSYGVTSSTDAAGGRCETRRF